jgi:hypothetical protein
LSLLFIIKSYPSSNKKPTMLSFLSWSSVQVESHKLSTF